jgi:uncharacterized protein (DUF885 family)
MRFSFIARIAFVLLLLPGGTHAHAADVAAFDAWVEKLTRDWLGAGQASPAASTEAAADPNAEETDTVPLDGLELRRTRRLALAREGLQTLLQWPDAALDPTRRVSAAVLRWHLELTVAQSAFTDLFDMGYFRQLRGLHLVLVDELTERKVLRRDADLRDYVQRLKKTASRIDEAIALTRRAAAHGCILPTFILERSQQQLQMFLEPPPEKNVLVTALERRTANVAGLSPARRAEAVAETTRLVAQEIRPAYQRVRALLAELLPRSRPAPGFNQLPRGEEAYALALRAFTTTAYSADAIHRIGLREVARLEAECEVILRQLGQTPGSFAERMARALAGPAVEGPDPHARVLARYTDHIRDAEQRCAPLFNLMPKSPVEVRRIPALTERTSSAHYTAPTLDGSRPGIFWVPLPGNALFYGARMRSLAYHEAIPGHHFQIALQQEQKDLPRFRARRIFGGISAHSEGWGLYVERLAVEQGWYDGDPAGRLGALSSELFRARRLVVDTGLHTKGWSRQQAIDYGIGASEVERYIVNPGQACSYMLGMLRILELRAQAQSQLGARFSLPAFHDVFLKTGSVPLEVLAQVIEAWIASQR